MSFLARLSVIDDLTRPDHFYLIPQDRCYYFGDYTARGGYAYSETNRLILNLKKPVSQASQNHYRYKHHAIQQIAQALQHSLDLQHITFVPVPPSKAHADPAYDDRLVQVLHTLTTQAPNAHYRELILQDQSLPAAHETQQRPNPITLAKHYRIDTQQLTDIREHLVIFDDVLTTGCHFKAMQRVLHRHLPNHAIIGVFVARRVPGSQTPDEINASNQ